MNGRDWVDDVRQVFSRQRTLLERALEQVSDEDFFREPDEVSNSCAVMIKHVAGNMRSRWTDFLTTDGEKPDRNRDGEFEIAGGEDRAAIEEALARGWKTLETALDSIDPERLDQTVSIRGEAHTVMQAVNRQISHYAHHIGQLVYLARMFAGPSWKSLSIPKGESETFNQMPDKYIDGK